MDYNKSSSNVCTCCPYGYHIDVDFIKLCESFSKSEINNDEVNYRNNNRYSRLRRTSSQTMGSLLGLQPNDTVRQNLFKMADEQPACASPCVQQSFQQAVQDFEQTLDSSSGYIKQRSIDSSPFSFERLYNISSSPYNDTKSSSEESEFQSSDSKEYTHDQAECRNKDRYAATIPEHKASINNHQLLINEMKQEIRFYVKRQHESGSHSSTPSKHDYLANGEVNYTKEEAEVWKEQLEGQVNDQQNCSPHCYKHRTDLSFSCSPQTKDIGVNCSKVITRDIGTLHRQHVPLTKNVATYTDQPNTKHTAVMTDRCCLSWKDATAVTTAVNLSQILQSSEEHATNMTTTVLINASTQTETDYRVDSAIQITPETRDSAVNAKPFVEDKCVEFDGTVVIPSNDRRNSKSKKSAAVCKIPKLDAANKTSVVADNKLQRQNTYTLPTSPTLECKEATFILPVVVPRSPNFDSSPPDFDADNLLLKCYSRTNIHNDNVYYFQPATKSRQKLKFCEEFGNVLEDLNDYLQKRRPHLAQSRINNILKIVQKEWFKVSSVSNADIRIIEGYLYNFKDISRTLLDYVVNMRDETGNTAMHYAISHSNFDVVSTLLSSNVCNANIVNNAGYTCVMLVPLAEIKSNAHYSVIKRLFSISNINMKAKKHGQTALMLAVSHGKADIVRLLLEAGADVNVQDDDGSTALMCATDHGYKAIIDLLISHPDCDLNISDNDGNTAIMIAAEAKNNDITLALYKKQQQLLERTSPSTTGRFNHVKFAQ